MERIVEKVNHLLIKKRKTVAVAESCTGGELAKLLTAIKGSSQYFVLGIVAYSNYAKERILKIPHSIILKEGAVSQRTTELLASSVRKLACADIGIGLTGIAGPTGQSREKPIGTVFIAIETEDKAFCRRFLFKGSRSTIRKKATLKTLELLREVLN